MSETPQLSSSSAFSSHTSSSGLKRKRHPDRDAAGAAAKQTFPFPFEPYANQERLMQLVYDAIEHKRIGIFESPTGTGKSLSILSSSLHWLSKNLDARQEKKPASSGLPSWITDFEDNTGASTTPITTSDASKKDLKSDRSSKSRKGHDLSSARSTSGGGVHIHKRKRRRKGKPSGASPANKENISGDDDMSDASSGDSDSSDGEADIGTSEDGPPFPQIVYASRTHSQLSQFVGEAKKIPTPFQFRTITLSSRKNYCINEHVSTKRSVQEVNDTCLDMREKATKSNPGCPALRRKTQRQFCDEVEHERVLDLEELTSLGRRLAACPYYGTRKAVNNAHLVTLPYLSLLHASTRGALGVRLKDNIVIIDEAHNLIEALNQMYSCTLTESDLKAAHFQLSQYFAKYAQRFKASNSQHIRQLLKTLEAVSAFARSSGSNGASASSAKHTNSNATAEAEIMSITDFEFRANLDHINFFELAQYVKTAELDKKLRGFVERTQAAASPAKSNARKPQSHSLRISREGARSSSSKSSNNKPHASPSSSAPSARQSASAITRFCSFLLALSEHSAEGRVVIRRSKEEGASIKFMLLNPARKFREIVTEARAVILIGGTMKPFEYFLDNVFPDVDASRLSTFSCGHVVDRRRLCALTLGHGPTKNRFDFSFKHRSDKKQIGELGRVLLNFCSVIPAGLVVFFPSFSFVDFVFDEWRRTGVLERLEKRKKIFREPRSAADVDTVLSQYADAVRGVDPSNASDKVGGAAAGGKPPQSATSRGGGALLACVVSAKMSEGINFSNDMARCVVMVGLPFANNRDPELCERIRYLNDNPPKHRSAHTGGGGGSMATSTSAGDLYYTLLCMRAVNQSIGRAIRWKGDYAALVLLDHRYTARINRHLPGWIQQDLVEAPSFGAAQRALGQFFRTVKTLGDV